MLKYRKIAVTGGLASGKSTVCQLLHQLFAKEGISSCLISADRIVDKLLVPETPLGKNLIQLLLANGIEEKSVVKEGHFIKHALAEHLFKSEELLKAWEMMVHPAVFIEMLAMYETATRNAPATCLIAEVPLLFEAHNISHFFDATVTVLCNQTIALKRFIAGGGTKEQYMLRMNNQMAPEEKAKKSTFSIANDGNQASLKQTIKDLFHLLTEESQPG